MKIIAKVFSACKKGSVQRIVFFYGKMLALQAMVSKLMFLSMGRKHSYFGFESKLLKLFSFKCTNGIKGY